LNSEKVLVLVNLTVEGILSVVFTDWWPVFPVFRNMRSVLSWKSSTGCHLLSEIW